MWWSAYYEDGDLTPRHKGEVAKKKCRGFFVTHLLALKFGTSEVEVLWSLAKLDDAPPLELRDRNLEFRAGKSPERHPNPLQTFEKTKNNLFCVPGGWGDVLDSFQLEIPDFCLEDPGGGASSNFGGLCSIDPWFLL